MGYRVWLGRALLLIAAAQLFGQSDPASKSFEVASVKLLAQPSSSVSTGGGPGTKDPGRLWRSNVSMTSLLIQAFQIQGHALVGPDWLFNGSERYEIAATVPPGAARADIPLMMQKLLVERFGLKFHREQKEMPGYALVTGKNPPKLISSSGTPAPIRGRDGFEDVPEGVAAGVIQVDSVGPVRRFAAGGMSMPGFADYLAGQSDRPVVDLTELRGKYDIVLYYSRSQNAAALPADNGLDLRSAVREQLGLELQSRRVRVDMVVIDHIERTPSPN